MNKKKWYIIILMIFIFTAGLILSFRVDSLLLDSFPWLIIVAMIIGIISGALGAKFKSKQLFENGSVIRHGTVAFIEHWVTAFGIFILIISGFMLGFLFFPPLANTYEKVFMPLNLHFIGIIITLAGGFYFLTDSILSKKLRMLIPDSKDILNGTIRKYLLKEKWSNETKYLSSQKSAFLAFAVIGAIQLITGSIKIAAHFLVMDPPVLAVNTLVHDIFSLFFIAMLITHILFTVAVSSHRVLLKSWITGKVGVKYVKEKHAAWYRELEKIIPKDSNLL